MCESEAAGPKGSRRLRGPQSVSLIGGFPAIIVEQLFGTAVLSGSAWARTRLRSELNKGKLYDSKKKKEKRAAAS